VAAGQVSKPSESLLLLKMLHRNPDLLIVLNHPMLDLVGIGKQCPGRTLRTLLCEHGEYIHALELSGIRSWEEYQAVLHLSEECQLVISGGDRHGREPNAAPNLSNAESFTEFVHEVSTRGSGGDASWIV